MGSLVHILLALAVVGAVELLADPAGPGPVVGPERPLLVLALALVPVAAGLVTRRLYLRGRFRSAALLQGVNGWLPLALHAVALVPLGWFRTSERWAGSSPGVLDWPQPALLLALAPFVLYMLVAIAARARLYGPGRAGAVRRFRVRMFLTGLLPVAAFLTCTGAIGLWPELRVNLEEVGLFAAAFAVVLLGAFLLSLPWIVRHVWSTSPLPRGYQRDLVEGLARHVDLRCGQVLVWDTENQMSNAAVVGIGPRRVVLLSDALLGELPPRELAAVFAHEAAHVKRHHVLIFLAWSLAFFVAADLVTLWTGIESELAATGVVALAFVAWYLAFGWLSRRFELEADLWSAETTRDPGALASALERVGSTHGRRTGWRHFGTEDRIDFLRRATLDPEVGRRLRTTLTRAGKLGALAMALTLALELWTLVDQLDEDRLRADLRLGHYESAETRLERSDDPDAELRAALVQARALPAPRTPEALVDSARLAAQRGQPDTARGLAELAYLRGADPALLQDLLDPE